MLNQLFSKQKQQTKKKIQTKKKDKHHPDYTTGYEY